MRALVLVLLALAGCDKVWGLERTPDAPTPLARWDSVAPGGTHACGIRLDHTLWCWGRNDLGQLGARASLADLEVVDPRQVGSDADWATVASGTFTSCAIKSDQTLWCWGDNRFGQVGNGKTQPVDVPFQIPGAWKLVAPGEVHTCAIAADDQLSCWGYNGRGQLGDGTVVDHYAPMPVLGSAQWLDVGTAELSTCGLQADHTMHCWGVDAYGQLGLDMGGGQTVPVPTKVLGGYTWSKLAVGNLFTCGVTEGRMRCWGRNDVGEIGDSSGTTRVLPTPVDQDLITDWTDVIAGREHVCGIRSTSEMLCWGSNENGQLLSDPARAFRGRPTALLEPPDGLVSLALGDHTTCAIDAIHQLWCGGYQPHSELRPVEVGDTWTDVRAGNSTTCALQGPTLACWGANGHGAVGDGTILDRQVPVVMAARTWTSVTIGGATVCARNLMTELSCWGANATAQVGLTGPMAVTDQTLPQSLGNGQPIAVATGGNHSCEIFNDHSMYCWGYNEFGQCGRAPNNPQIQVGAALQFGAWNSVALGYGHTCAIDYATGYVACSGLGTDGQCGTGFAAPTDQLALVVVPGMPAFSSITSGALFTCGLAGTAAWCWGSNTRGQLGNQTTVPAGLAIAFPGAWQQLSAGYDHVCGIHTDGTLWCTGANGYGQLGDGTLAEEHEVVQVGTDTDWAQVAAGQEHTCARKQAGKLYCWGGNRSGELGLGTAWRATLEQIQH